jgi:hypothetical protein
MVGLCFTASFTTIRSSLTVHSSSLLLLVLVQSLTPIVVDISAVLALQAQGVVVVLPERPVSILSRCSASRTSAVLLDTGLCLIFTGRSFPFPSVAGRRSSSLAASACGAVLRSRKKKLPYLVVLKTSLAFSPPSEDARSLASRV